ncbi:MAG TPA: tRNA pseudouridine(55) synthase TruB [Pyrinomonadaceae bacterium]|nr:tRNA pseudouridine(55) synthase TruB [Pyrinomonadaceae bacterium]
MDGVLIIDKPPDLTSHDVIARVRHILHERRIGHTGTLDPFATGVLVVLVGRATRVAQFLSGVDKEYEAIIRLGYATDTGDRTGSRINLATESGKVGPWSEAEVESAMVALRGYINQTPPMYSAKKKDGRKLYELARRGEEVERQPVRVCIHEFLAIRPNGELMKDNLDGTFDFQVRVACSSGTYVRTLAEDFGKRLNVGAHLAELRRTRVGDMTIDGAITLDDLKTRQSEDALGTVLLSAGTALSRLPFVHLSHDDVRRVRNGLEVTAEKNTNWPDETKVRMYDAEGQLIAIGDFNKVSGRLHPRVVIAREN